MYKLQDKCIIYQAHFPQRLIPDGYTFINIQPRLETGSFKNDNSYPRKACEVSFEEAVLNIIEEGSRIILKLNITRKQLRIT